MKFKNKATGNILEVKNEKAVELLKSNPDQYEAIKAPARKAKTADADEDSND